MAEEPEGVDIVLEDEDLKTPEPEEQSAVEAAPEPEKPKRGRPPKAAAAPEPEPEAPKVVEPEVGLEQLKANLAASQAREAEANRRAQEAEQRATQAQGTVQDSRVSQVEAMIAASKTAIASQKGDLQAAWQEQDFAKAADIQEAMAKTAADLRMMETGLEQLKAQPKPQPQIREVADPLIPFAADLDRQGNVNSAAWIRAHPEYIRDPMLTRRMIAAANLAETDGHRIDSPEYIAAIERTLGMALPGERPVAETTPRQSAPPAAPVTRGPNGGASRPTVVRLSPDERDIAHLNFPDLSEPDAEKEYARQKYLLQTEGRMQ